MVDGCECSHKSNRSHIVIGNQYKCEKTQASDTQRLSGLWPTRFSSTAAAPTGPTEKKNLVAGSQSAPGLKSGHTYCALEPQQYTRPAAGGAMKFDSSLWAKYGNIRFLGVVLFIVASIFCLYQIYQLDKQPPGPKYLYRTELKLVNLFNRHGDRSPSDSLPKNDPYANQTNSFWPNGLNNLTDVGRFRQYKLGLELRHRYNDLLGYDADRVLVFSSPMLRCRESIEHTLRGLFDIEMTLDSGLEVASRIKCDAATDSNSTTIAANSTLNFEGIPGSHCVSSSGLPTGSGTGNQWHQIPIDTKSLPMLIYSYLNNCKYRKEHSSPVDLDLRASEAIRRLPSLAELEQVLAQRFGAKLNFSALGLWSTLASEVRLAKTTQTAPLARHLYDWINRPVKEEVRPLGGKGLLGGARHRHKQRARAPTLFDLFEHMALLGYRDRIVGEADYIQLAALVHSLVSSQQTALGVAGGEQTYANKRMVFYSTHDSILQLLMHRLNIISANQTSANFVSRFGELAAKDEVEKLLAGLKMTEFGASLAFELWESSATQTNGQQQQQQAAATSKKFAYIQLQLYNKQDAKWSGIEYRRLRFGSICRRLFAELYPNVGSRELERRFYDSAADLPNFDPIHHCPFELFRNITHTKYPWSESRLTQLCPGGAT